MAMNGPLENLKNRYIGDLGLEALLETDLLDSIRRLNLSKII